MSLSEAMRLVSKLAAFFPEVPEERLAAYASALQHEYMFDLERAVDFLAADSGRFPPLKAIRERLLVEREHGKQLTGPPLEDRIRRGWREAVAFYVERGISREKAERLVGSNPAMGVSS